MFIYGVVYKATNRFNGFVYVGQARNFEQRKLVHLNNASLTSQNLFEYDLAKFPHDIKFEIVCYCLNQESLDFIEALMIQYYKRIGRSYNSQRTVRAKIKRGLKNA